MKKTYVKGLAAVLLMAVAGPVLADNAGPSMTDKPTEAASQMPLGEQVYTTTCQECHMPNAMGAEGAGRYPALAKNPKLAAKQYPMVMVVNGSKAMPSFARQLDADEIAAVVNYVRTHFGNNYKDKVTAAEVKAVLPKTGPYEGH
ncbi:c-type cytochrome [Solimonas marina]|uniref:Cytochrome c n=1 Tax=Solimonas marina TaxID=2714601 RepID=A0A970BAZ3_9GAMM|nr:cytochrome c [Solimonas marina]NKF23871.1 cytochrome c [Solimonas marina]